MTQFRAKSAIRDPKLRELVKRVLLEYRKSGSAALNQNLKHVLRMVREVRCDFESLEKIGCDPQILEAAILISDLGKESHILAKYRHLYGGSTFRAFLDHSRNSMREGNELRKEIGLSDVIWRRILAAIIGHDGPSVAGSWWKENYERELGRKYASIHSREALIHCYLDRIDQGGIFRSRSGQLNGGLRKISYDIFSKDPQYGKNFSATIIELFGTTRLGTQNQIDYLDEVEKPRLLGSTQLPKIVREMKRKFIEAEKFFERVVINPELETSVRVVLDHGESVEVSTLDDFWRALAQVTFKGSESSFGQRTHTA